MGQETKKIDKRIIRAIVGVVLVCVSMTTGVIFGVKITANKKQPLSTMTPSEQLIELLKTNWYSDIYYGKDIDESVLINQFIGALSTNDEIRLDPYTYLKKNIPSTPVQQSGKLGITVSYFFNYPVIVDVDETGAAYGKLQIGDIIVSTGQNNSEEYKIVDDDVNYSNVLSLALGAPNTNTFIKVARFDVVNNISFKDYEITLKKGSSSNYAYLEKENIDDTIMVKLTGFTTGNGNDDTCNQLSTILNRNEANNLILDIRDNGGGDLSSVVNICDLFLPANKLVTSLVFKDGTKSSYYTRSDSKYDYDNIIILQNENTASASEILISTLQYYFNDKVTLIGTKSYGKGIAQRTESVLNNHYSLQYTCAKWLRPDDSWIGMTDSYYTTNYQLGFDPLPSNQIYKNDLLKKMESNNQYVFFKNNFNAYKLDEVSSPNKYLFEIYNLAFDTNYRTDYYFDSDSQNAINEFQINNNLTPSTMNEETFLYFVKMFYDERMSYLNEFENKAKQIIEA